MIDAVEIAFTVLPVTDLPNSRAFYEGVLGLKPSSVFEKGTMGFIEYDIGGAALAIGCGAPLFKPSKDGGAIALEVRDFDSAVEALRKAGCAFVQEPGDTPVCRMATITDPDGNFIMIHKRKGAAVGSH
jgi:predicted enzyme related to lactoylglutathione lyase